VPEWITKEPGVRAVLVPESAIAALSGGEAPVAWRIYWSEAAPEYYELCRDRERVERILAAVDAPRIESLYTTPRAVGDGMASFVRDFLAEYEEFEESQWSPQWRELAERARALSAAPSEGSAQGEPVSNPDKLPASTGQVHGHDLIAARQEWYEQQINEAERRWLDGFSRRYEEGDDVPSMGHFVALWLAERTPPTATKGPHHD
jgi:hypothetical protein